MSSPGTPQAPPRLDPPAELAVSERTPGLHADADRPRTVRAFLTYLNSLLQQAAAIIIKLVLTPLIIASVGTGLYGAWMMIQRVTGYLAVTDFRPLSALKLKMAVLQHDREREEKKRLIGAAFTLWLITVPVLLVLGAGTVWFAPSFIRVNAGDVGAVRIALALLVAGILVQRLASLPGGILKGMNVDYKAMGLNAVSVLLTGGLSMIALWLGWGLPGLAGSVVLGAALIGVVRLYIAKRVMPWLAMRRPRKGELGAFAGLSAWMMAAGLGTRLIEGSDLLIVGYLLGPEAAGVFAATAAAMLFAERPVAQMVSAVGPGIADLTGRTDWDRLLQVRRQVHVLTFWFVGNIGTLVLALNKSFVTLWVGWPLYGGAAATLFIVIAVLLRALTRVDAQIVDATLRMSERAALTLVSGTVVVVGGFLLTPRYGLAGMAAAMVGGSLLFETLLSRVIFRHTGAAAASHVAGVLRPALVTTVLYAAGFLFGERWIAGSWPEFSGVLLVMAFVTTAVSMLALPVTERRALLERARLVGRGIKRKPPEK